MKFEPPTFFTIGFAPSEDEGRSLARAMPSEYQRLGHFTVSSVPDRFGWYEVKWNCHKLSQMQPLIELPFRVVTTEHICKDKGMPIPVNFERART